MTVVGSRFEHAELRVNDLSLAVDFYTDVIGLVELAREKETVYLGSGLDENYDLAIVEGGTGVAHFAIRVDDEEQFNRELERLDEHRVRYDRHDGTEPGQHLAARFRLPSGHAMEYVVVEDNRYLNPLKPAHPRRRGFSPLDADHINLVASDVKNIARFLHEVLGFRLTDATVRDGESWTGAWARYGAYHHDVAVTISRNPSHTLHHFAWTMANFEHMKVAADMLAEAGIRLEMGPSRHPIGPNLFMYFLEPGGNRFELSAEGASIDPSTPTTFWQGLDETLDGWGQAHLRMPDTFFDGS